MKRLCLAILCSLVVMPLASAHAANILVMGEDAGEPGARLDTVVVARDTRVFRQVLDAISEELTHDGYSVFDERAVTLDGFKQDRSSRGEAELLDIARSVTRPPMDAVVMFTVYAGARKLAYTTDIYARITGRIINVRTGQSLGSFEVASPKGWRAAAGCQGDCLLEVIGKNAAAMSGDLGGALAEKLDVLNRQKDQRPAPAPAPVIGPVIAKAAPGYTLSFAGFAPDEINDVEEYLVAFKGYKAHHALAATSRGARYSYETDSDSGNLTHDLRMMLDRIGAEGKITFSAPDKTFLVERAGSQ